MENCNDCLKYNEGMAPYVSGRTEAGIATGMGGRYFFWLAASASDVTVETDADGYVQSVTITADSQNGSCGYQSA